MKIIQILKEQTEKEAKQCKGVKIVINKNRESNWFVLLWKRELTGDLKIGLSVSNILDDSATHGIKGDITGIISI